ncbi:cytochrome b561 and DOMON domain-containing protein At5g47530-like isoform X1 [Cucurbita pepo subsp. pepo]|uniref:cytochrome b561 and DOMON domain-containing protein At5g47530-like isoform X1 n=1 Tax=Cucurbita pepo subsp. pepo TaxID=3664 RepID=UPI000C9D4D2A|nr:cytochrome b561 and DOMON domain-containing protein At5g47530-like isoform X1 [Cucurbita pepo subsp. pepo]
MGSRFQFFLILSLIFALSDSTAAQQENTTSGHHTPDTKVTSAPKIWKSPGLGYSTLLRQVHGVLNIIGWGTLIPIGIVIARYFREEFPLKCDRWYSAHAVCQTCGYIMGTVGWGFGVSLINSSNRSHVPFLVLGILVILLTAIQICGICVQQKKESGRRGRWEMWHRGMGYVILALIIADIFEGINAQRHPKKWRWTYVGILLALGVVAAGLEVYRYIKLKRFKQAMKLNANMYSSTTTN